MKYSVLFLSVFLFLPISVFATESVPESPESAVITINPNLPEPNASVVAEVSSSIFQNLNTSNISWYIDGVLKKKEVGGAKFQFQAPSSGITSTISVNVEKGLGTLLTESIKITPSDLDLIYESNTYTPPFYKGRSIFTYQSTANIGAMPNFIVNGARVKKENVVYNWYKDGIYLPGESGVGKDSIRIQDGYISRPFYISVVASPLNSSISATKRIYINSTTPNVVLYENNPLYGSIFEKALTGTFNMDREEVGITAVPYFFNVTNKDSADLRYVWVENGKAIGDETFGSFISYLNPSREKSGIANLGVGVENIQNILQAGNNSFVVNVIGNERFDTIENNNENSTF